MNPSFGRADEDQLSAVVLNEYGDFQPSPFVDYSQPHHRIYSPINGGLEFYYLKEASNLKVIK